MALTVACWSAGISSFIFRRHPEMLTCFRKILKAVPGFQRYVWRRRQDRRRSEVEQARRAILQSEHYEILIVFGMRRSGNHFLITWILDQVDGTAVFYNNINPEREPETGRMTETRRREGKRPRIVLSYEDAEPAAMLAGPLSSYLEAHRARGAGIRFAVVLRDPYNLFASRLAKWPERFADDRMITAQQHLYRNHANLAIDPRPIWHDAPLVPLIYNKLLQDQDVRSKTSDALGIFRGNDGLDTVPVYGHGSSFAGTSQAARDLRGEVMDRWRHKVTDPAFQKVMGDPELQRIAQGFFGLPPLTFSSVATTTS